MDRKSIIIIVVCFALLMFWPKLVNHVFPPVVSTNQVAVATNQLVGGTNQYVAGTNQPVSSVTSMGTNAGGRFVVHAEIPEQLEEVTTDEGHYIFTSRGGGLKEVELTRYPESVSAVRRKNAPTNELATLNAPATAPVLAILGDDSVQGDGVFKLTRINGGVRAEKTLPSGLSIVKEFHVGTNYLISADVKLENQSKQPLALPAQEWVAGTATPMGPQDNGMAVSGVWYDGNKPNVVNQSWFHPRTFIFFPAPPRSEYAVDNTNVVWVAAENQFFALATMPKTPAPGLVVRMVDLPRPNREEMSANSRTVAEPKGYQTALTYPALTLEPGRGTEQQFNVYAGPKEHHTLAQIGAQFNNRIDLVMNFNGFIGGMASALLGAMNWLHYSLVIPYGWAIVTITVLIKLIFWPLTQYSTRSMKRMQALQPQMKAMQEKYKDDPTKLSQKQMEFWRKNKVNPLSGCLPMMLQIPVFMGFYRMLQSAIELRGAHFLWIGDLSKPDTMFVLPGLNFPINPMPLIMGATMLWQASMTPPSPGMDPGQQKIMRFMPLMMLVFLYNFSSGLALYWTVQNLLTVLQTKLTRNQPTPAVSTPAPVAPQKKNK